MTTSLRLLPPRSNHKDILPNPRCTLRRIAALMCVAVFATTSAATAAAETRPGLFQDLQDLFRDSFDAERTAEGRDGEHVDIDKLVRDIEEIFSPRPKEDGESADKEPPDGVKEEPWTLSDTPCGPADSKVQPRASELFKALRDAPRIDGHPWGGDEAALVEWCGAVADTHTLPWQDGMVPGRVRTTENGLQKSEDTKEYFMESLRAFDRLVGMPKPKILRGSAIAARQLVYTESCVFAAHDWNYSRALSRGATMAPPLGIRWTNDFSAAINPIHITADRWCWTDPADRG